MTTPDVICIAGAAVLVFAGLICVCPDQLRNTCDRLAGAFSRGPKGKRLAAEWEKCAARRKLLFSQNIFTKDGDIVSTLPQDRLALALVEIVSWQNQLHLTISGAISGYCLASAFTVAMFFCGYIVNYPPFILNTLQANGFLYAMHFCAAAGCVCIALMFAINIRLALLRGLVNAVKTKIMMALALRM
ncbi:MAG: hypothetical protein ACLQVA_00620 [Candidatus Brocadiia bacterium]